MKIDYPLQCFTTSYRKPVVNIITFYKPQRNPLPGLTLINSSSAQNYFIKQAHTWNKKQKSQGQVEQKSRYTTKQKK